MTFDECQDRLTGIRRRQGTRYPKIRIDCGGASYRGRLARADSDPEFRPQPLAPQGALVLEDLKTGRATQTTVPLDQITADHLHELDEDYS